MQQTCAAYVASGEGVCDARQRVHGLWPPAATSLPPRPTAVFEVAKLPEWDGRVMNAGLCPARGHHIPLEPLCGAEERAGQGGRGLQGETRTRISQAHIKDSWGCVPLM